MKYIVDIDGTICTNTHGDYTNAVPYPERIEKINNLYESGNTVIYWTARGGNTGRDWSNLTEEQLKRWGCKYSEVWHRKPAYDVWIDDKAANSEDWF